jgi:biopolymer transport protein TolQ
VGSGFLTTVGQSGAVGQGIVTLLFIVSIYAWAIIIFKSGMVRRASASSFAFLRKFREDPDGMISHYADRQRFTPSPFARILEAGLAELALLMGGRGRAAVAQPLTMVQVDALERTLETAISEEVIELRRHLIALATTAAGAPFVGLFGTVWGIMKAFAAMSVTGSASISSVAPGVSAALTTTVAGLAVAIPALVGYNYLMNRVRNLTAHMENFSSEFLSSVERNLGAR